MNNNPFKTYCIFTLGSISALLIIATSIVTAKRGFGMEDLSYKQFILHSILNEFSSYWLLVIVVFVFSILVIFCSIRKIYLLNLLKKRKR